MSAPVFLTIYSNGDIWFSTDVGFVAPSSESGTVVKHFRINSGAAAQKITTLTGSGNASASALAATNGSATSRHGKSGLDNEDFN